LFHVFCLPEEYKDENQVLRAKQQLRKPKQIGDTVSPNQLVQPGQPVEQGIITQVPNEPQHLDLSIQQVTNGNTTSTQASSVKPPESISEHDVTHSVSTM
jgi:hypothetical protein